MELPELTPRQVENFWAKVPVGAEDVCWDWEGCTSGKDKQGMFMVWQGSRENSRAWLASRIMYVLTNGPIPEVICVLHTCDRPICVNPSHLFLGTQRDNMIDCADKLRIAGQKN